MTEYFKRDPAGVPQEITNRIAKRIMEANADGYATTWNLRQMGAADSGDPASGSGDTGGEAPILDALRQRIGTKRMSDKERLDQALKLWRADLDKQIAANNELLAIACRRRMP